jgi:magnesium transporter
VDRPGEAGFLERLQAVFGLHWLAIEDLRHSQQRSKVEDYANHHFIVARMVTPNTVLETEQIGMFVNQKYLVTVQERPGGDCLDPVRERIRRGADNVRKYGSAYLVYTILDTIVDAYFPVLERYGELLEDLEDQILLSPTTDLLGKIHEVKRDLLTLRRSIWPLRDALHALMHSTGLFADQEIVFYLRDCYDHTIRVIELIETDRELCSDLMDFYLSSVGNRTNEVMKVLALISTIFMPLTFVAGVYGMNFNTDISPWNMPELNWFWGYPFALILMAAFSGGMVYYFRRRGWL